MAVVVRSAHKRYGNGPEILNNLDLTVEPGTIYGLLGPSGCGKTTLLSCMVGLGKLDSGTISIYGQVPGQKGSSIPGPGLGFMPQDAALYPNLNILEILSHYGRIYGMSHSEIEERSKFLLDFLHLPDPERLVRSLSGGELRCVSLAVTMIHEAPLLILDEPTAGLDPLLARRIWEHLHETVKADGKTTVIITTQYIPEAMFSDKVGIMRKGRILTEENPHILLQRYGTDSIEKVFLLLCKKDKNEQAKVANEASVKSNRGKAQIENPSETIQDPVVTLRSVKVIKHEKDGELCHGEIESVTGSLKRRRKPTDSAIIYTLVKKLVLRQARVPVNVFLLLFIPILLIYLINSIVGTIPKNLTLGYVVGEEDLSANYNCNSFYEKLSANSSAVRNCFAEDHLQYICSYLKIVGDYGHDIRLVPVDKESTALDQVHQGLTIGFLVFPSNFSDHFQDRLALRNFADEATLLGSTIKVRLDMSNSIYSMSLRTALLRSYLKFMKEAVTDCGVDASLVTPPLKFNSVFNDISLPLEWSHYIQPGSVVLIMSVLSNAPGMMAAIEKRLGFRSRDFVAGVKFRHLVASTLIHGSLVIFLQLSTTFTFLPFVFGMTSQGPWILVLLVTFLSSLSGVSLGFLWGTAAIHESEVIIIILALNILYLGPAMYPLETVLPAWYRWFCYTFPVTPPVLSMRSILHRGWDLSNFYIQAGLGTTVAWVVCPIAVAYLFHNRRRGVGDVNK